MKNNKFQEASRMGSELVTQIKQAGGQDLSHIEVVGLSDLIELSVRIRFAAVEVGMRVPAQFEEFLIDLIEETRLNKES